MLRVIKTVIALSTVKSCGSRLRKRACISLGKVILQAQRRVICQDKFIDRDSDPPEAAGINPIEAGFRKFTVDSQPASLKYFTLKQPTVHGAIKCQNADSSAKYRSGIPKLLLPFRSTPFVNQ